MHDVRNMHAHATTNSPMAASTSASSFQIFIRNCLLNQAACAYLQSLLQPSSFLASSSRIHLLVCLWLRFSALYLRNPFAGSLDVITKEILPALAELGVSDEEEGQSSVTSSAAASSPLTVTSNLTAMAIKKQTGGY